VVLLGGCIVLFSLLLCVASYSETDAKKFLDYCGASYCCGTLGKGCETWDCSACKKQPGFINRTVIYNRTTNANAFIGYSTQDNSVVLAFAGTNPLSIKNWIDDIDFIKTKFDACSGCEVHAGFYGTYLSVRSQIHSAFQGLQKAYPNATLSVTGHSLGAALTVHGALDLIDSYPTVKLSGVYSYGQPRTGNKAFEEYYTQRVTQASGQSPWRVTHWRDPVPHLPLESWNFHHNPTEVFYDALNTGYKICDGSGEDSSCSDQFLVDVNVLDHLNYIGFDFVTNFLGCRI